MAHEASTAESPSGRLRRRRRLLILDALAVALLCSVCSVNGILTTDDDITTSTMKTENGTPSMDSSSAPPPPPDPSTSPTSSPSLTPSLPPSTPSPYALWDEASAEQEVESEHGHHVPHPQASSSNLSSTPPSPAPPSFLLVLVGNATVARLRRRDFAKYVRVNLAARLSLEYDQVALESVVLAPPSILVNVTVSGASTGAGGAPSRALMRMAQTNATLLELSGEEFRVSKVITASSLLTPKETAEGSTAALRHEQLERGVFSASGAAIGLLILVAAAFGIAARFRRGRCGGVGGKATPLEPPLPPPPPPPPLRPRRRPLAPPKVIYTGAFALTLGAAGRGTVRMPLGGCAVHHSGLAGRRVGGGPVGDGWRKKGAEGRWEEGKVSQGSVRRPCLHPPPSQRHLTPTAAWNAANDCAFDNPNFEK